MGVKDSGGRVVVLDTETTGIDPSQGHRIIEIGCVEMVERQLTGRHYHVYINPEREVEAEAMSVHGITDDFLADKPLFRDVADEFFRFIEGAQLVIHNAPFDVGFMDSEFSRLEAPRLTADHCGILDTLAIARKKHPGQKNNLNALCKRYGVDNSSRELHGALLDAEILADVYLLMTGGQTALSLDAHSDREGGIAPVRRVAADRKPLPVIRATDAEDEAHRVMLEVVGKASGRALWNTLEPSPSDSGAS
jgi:DNA polymerase-3 subunit epsilon